MKLRSVFLGLASLVLATSAHAATKIGTFGQGVDFFVQKIERSEEGAWNTVSVNGHMVNQYGVPAPFQVALICKPSGTIFVSFAGKNWDMEVKDRVRKWESVSPSMGGYFAIYERYCTPKYRKSVMSAKDRKSFMEND